MSNNVIFVTENIAIVQSEGSICPATPTISAHDLPMSYGTVSLRVAESEAVTENEYTNIKLLFGSWLESRDEEEKLEEIYRSRLVSSDQS